MTNAAWGSDPSRITALEPQLRRAGRVNIYVDRKFCVGVFEDVVVTLGLRVGQAITPERLEEIAAAETLRRAKEDALRLLSYRDRSEKEFSDRLRRKGYVEPDIAAVLEYLRTAGLVDDAVFAERWVEWRGASRGKRALLHELRQKGVTGETAAAAVGAADEGPERERMAALETAVKRVGARPADQTEPARRRLQGFLSRRGFDYPAIRFVMERLYGNPPGAAETAEEFNE